jgi:hypothetical protein
MRFKPPNCKRLQGAADARRRARRRTFVLQVPDNKSDAVRCERLQRFFSCDNFRDYGLESFSLCGRRMPHIKLLITFNLLPVLEALSMIGMLLFFLCYLFLR